MDEYAHQLINLQAALRHALWLRDNESIPHHIRDIAEPIVDECRIALAVFLADQTPLRTPKG